MLKNTTMTALSRRRGAKGGMMTVAMGGFWLHAIVSLANLARSVLRPT